MKYFNGQKAGNFEPTESTNVVELDQNAISEGVTAANGTAQDALDMGRLGKTQLFQRNFRYFSMLGLASTITCTWEGALASAGLALLNGGLGGFVWAFLITTICFGTVVFSMADMASAPTSGGQYHWVSEFAPKSKQRFLSYMTGWTAALGWQAALASVSFIAATLIQGLLVLNYDEYVFHRAHGTLLLIAIATVATIFNTYGAKYLPVIEYFILLLHICGFIIILIILWVLAPKITAREVFATFNNGGGWMNAAAACAVGQLASLYSYLGADCVAHMAEEIRDASRVVPITMVSTQILNGCMGFALVVMFCFCVTSLDGALGSKTGYPIIEVFYTATNSKSYATGMTVIFILLFTCASIGILATASRQAFAFARDQGLPFSSFVSKITKVGVEIPLNAILISLGMTVIIGLINIGSTAAFNSVVGTVVAADLSTYGISIACIMARRLRHQPLLPARWTMGAFALPVNVIAVVYIIFALIMSFFPAVRIDLTPVTMNWSSVIYCGVLGIALLLYLIQGREVYKGPVAYVRRLD